MEHDAYEASIEVPPPGAAHDAEASPDVLAVSKPLALLTWITFLLLLWVLYKVAWKPILKALDAREQSVRKALQDAEQARAATAEAEARTQAMLREAQAQARQIVTEAKTAAQGMARTLEAQAKSSAQGILDEARRDIQVATERARSELRRESAELAIQLAEKVVGANMDSARNRDLVRELAKEL